MKIFISLSPKTVFKCSYIRRAHLCFENDLKGENFGIINVELDGCAVMFWPALKTTIQGLKFWWAAEVVIGIGQNNVVIGNMSHINILTQVIPAVTSYDPGDFTRPYKACYSDGNALVANNLISKSTTSMKTTITLDGDKMTVPYLVYNRYGIDINQILLGVVIGNYMGHKYPFQSGTLTPSCFPWYFRKRIGDL